MRVLCYNTLGIGRTATATDVRSAFRRCALQRHPDKGGTAEQFRALVQAFELLANPESRRQYDQALVASGSKDGLEVREPRPCSSNETSGSNLKVEGGPEPPSASFCKRPSRKAKAAPRARAAGQKPRARRHKSTEASAWTAPKREDAASAAKVAPERPAEQRLALREDFHAAQQLEHLLQQDSSSWPAVLSGLAEAELRSLLTCIEDALKDMSTSLGKRKRTGFEEVAESTGFEEANGSAGGALLALTDEPDSQQLHGANVEASPGSRRKGPMQGITNRGCCYQSATMISNLELRSTNARTLDAAIGFHITLVMLKASVLDSIKRTPPVPFDEAMKSALAESAQSMACQGMRLYFTVRIWYPKHVNLSFKDLDLALTARCTLRDARLSGAEELDEVCERLRNEARSRMRARREMKLRLIEEARLGQRALRKARCEARRQARQSVFCERRKQKAQLRSLVKAVQQELRVRAQSRRRLALEAQQIAKREAQEQRRLERCMEREARTSMCQMRRGLAREGLAALPSGVQWDAQAAAFFAVLDNLEGPRRGSVAEAKRDAGDLQGARSRGGEGALRTALADLEIAAFGSLYGVPWEVP